MTSEAHRSPGFLGLLRRLSAKALAWVVLGLCLALTLWSWQTARLRALESDRLAFAERAEEIRSTIRRRMEAYEQVIRGGGALFAAAGSVDRRTWRRFVDTLDLPRNYPGMVALGYAAWVPGSRLEAHVTAVRASGLKDYRVLPEGRRELYTPIVYIEPFEGRNLRALGFDMYSEENRRKAMEAARDSGQPALTGRVTLIQESSEDVQNGFLMYLPIYARDRRVETVAERREALVGFVYSPFRMGELMQGLFGASQGDLDVEVFDGLTLSASTLMFDTDDRQGAIHDGGRSPRLAESSVVFVADRPWTLHVTARPNFSEHHGLEPPLVLGGGLTLSLLLFAFIWSLATQRERALALAESRTEALQRAHDELELRVDQRTRELASANQALMEEVMERKKAQAEREALLEEEHRLRQEAEAATRAKDELLSVVSHELRTPLTAILGWAHLLGRTSDPATLAKGAAAITRNIHLQKQIVDDLLDTTRIASGKLKLEMRAVNLRALAEQAIEVLRPMAEARGVSLVSELGAPGEPISGDPDRLQQVAWNLVSNAIKFTPRGGRVLLRLEQRPETMRMTVEDNGVGIPVALLPHVFEPFRQSDSSSTRRHGGLGLGLAIAKRLVELHGGEVRVHSEGEGRGARFTVDLPRRPPPALLPGRAASAAQGEGAPASEPRAPSLAGLRVLVVDDQEDARELLQVALARYGARVDTVGSAREGYELMEKSGRPDVLVCDIAMPGEDGYSLVRRVRAREAEAGLAALPALALTAFTQPRDREQALQAGFQEHVGKPVEPDRLAAAVARAVGRA